MLQSGYALWFHASSLLHRQEVQIEAVFYPPAGYSPQSDDTLPLRVDVALGIVTFTDRFRYLCGAIASSSLTDDEEAAQRMLGKFGSTVQLLLALKDNRLLITCKLGEIFGSQPFLAIKTKDGQYLHDNLDFTSDGKSWTYTFDEQTLELNEVAIIGVSSAGKFGGSFTERIFL